MNSRNITSVILLTACFLLLSTIGQAQSLHLKGPIPFAFQVGEKTLPMGEYHIVKLNGPGNVFVVRGDSAVVARISYPTLSSKVKEQSVLIFNKYQDNGGEVSYFLKNIWAAGQAVGFEYPQSRAERAAALRAARRDVITLVVQRANSHTE